MILRDAIERFDRRERRAVLRLCGGESAALLDERFAKRLEGMLGLEPDAAISAPWYIDYTWNWLAAALMILARGESSCATLDEVKAYPRLVSNNQEDIDALIVVDNVLILIEAKWDGHWRSESNHKQLVRKIRRFATLRRWLDHLGLKDQVKLQMIIASREQQDRAAVGRPRLHVSGLRRSIRHIDLREMLGEPCDLLDVAYPTRAAFKELRVRKATGWPRSSLAQAR